MRSYTLKLDSLEGVALVTLHVGRATGALSDAANETQIHFPQSRFEVATVQAV